MYNFTFSFFSFLECESHEIELIRIPGAILQTACIICVKWFFMHPMVNNKDKLINHARN